MEEPKEKPKRGRPKKKPAPEPEQPVDNFKNIHNAVVEVRSLYRGQIAKPGYRWYVWTFRFMKKKINKKGKIFLEKNTRQGGSMILKTFEAEYGEENVKRMVIQNIVNKEKV